MKQKGKKYEKVTPYSVPYGFDPVDPPLSWRVENGAGRQVGTEKREAFQLRLLAELGAVGVMDWRKNKSDAMCSEK